MSRNKWKKFHSTYSSIDITQPDNQGANPLADWRREAKLPSPRVFINGVGLDKYAEKYNKFQSESDLETFFNEVILQGMTTVDKEEKEKIVQHLKINFHQGGYLYPVTSAIAMSMKEYSEEFGMDVYRATVDDAQKILSVNIVTTDKGFRVQEFTQLNSLLVSPGYEKEFGMDPEKGPFLKPEEGSKYVIKAQGTINIDFSESANQPSIEVESNTMSFGHSAIKNQLDKRHLGQIIVDFFKDVFGLNKVSVISPEKDEPVEGPEHETKLIL